MFVFAAKTVSRLKSFKELFLDGNKFEVKAAIKTTSKEDSNDNNYPARHKVTMKRLRLPKTSKLSRKNS
jgi:hypothetical protein